MLGAAVYAVARGRRRLLRHARQRLRGEDCRPCGRKRAHVRRNVAHAGQHSHRLLAARLRLAPRLHERHGREQAQCALGQRNSARLHLEQHAQLPQHPEPRRGELRGSIAPAGAGLGVPVRSLRGSAMPCTAGHLLTSSALLCVPLIARQPCNMLHSSSRRAAPSSTSVPVTKARTSWSAYASRAPASSVAASCDTALLLATPSKPALA